MVETIFSLAVDSIFIFVSFFICGVNENKFPQSKQVLNLALSNVQFFVLELYANECIFNEIIPPLHI